MSGEQIALAIPAAYKQTIETKRAHFIKPQELVSQDLTKSQNHGIGVNFQTPFQRSFDVLINFITV